MRSTTRRTWAAATIVAVVLAVSCTNPARGWTDVSPPPALPTEPEPAWPVDVSCVADAFCLVVGYESRYEGGRNLIRPVVSAWRDGRWSETVVDDRQLEGVSCASPTHCVVTGRNNFWVWDGTALQPTPIVVVWPGETRYSRTDVSCPAVDWCVAVGDNRGAVWQRGVGWRDQGVVNEYGWGATVSCTSPAFCLTAGGRSYATWNGSRWSAPVDLHPDVPDEKNVGVVAVDCVADRECVVSTQVQEPPPPPPTPPHTTTVVRRWRNGLWTPEQGTVPADLSCGSRTRCLGLAPSGPVVRDGRPWTATPPPPVLTDPARTNFSAVSCAPAWCLVVGSEEHDESGGRRIVVAARWRF